VLLKIAEHPSTRQISFGGKSLKHKKSRGNCAVQQQLTDKTHSRLARPSFKG